MDVLPSDEEFDSQCIELLCSENFQEGESKDFPVLVSSSVCSDTTASLTSSPVSPPETVRESHIGDGGYDDLGVPGLFFPDSPLFREQANSVAQSNKKAAKFFKSQYLERIIYNDKKRFLKIII